MKNTNNIDPTNRLASIQKVHAPEYMLTRIYAKIDSLKEIKVKPSTAWSMIGGVAMVIIINVAILFQNNSTIQSESTIISEMGMEINNSIY